VCIYIAARKQAPDIYKGTNHGHFPKGPAGRFYRLPTYNSCVMAPEEAVKWADGELRKITPRAASTPGRSPSIPPSAATDVAELRVERGGARRPLDAAFGLPLASTACTST